MSDGVTGRGQSAGLNPREEHGRRITYKLTIELGQDVMRRLEDPEVIEIMLNPDGSLWEERFGAPMTKIGTLSASKAESAMATIASSLNTEINAHNPILECELPIDGSRFEGMIPPAVSAPTFTIRKKALRVFTLAEYVDSGALSPEMYDMIDAAVSNRQNILVVGGTGSGKTTLSNAIIKHITDTHPQDRLVIIEDTGELQCSAQNYVPMRAVDNVDMTRLLKATMRMRPDRIVVGEVRDGAALALLKAWNTGHPGGVATIHANSAYAGLTRMEQLVSEASIAPMKDLIAEAINIVIFIAKDVDVRRIKEVVSVSGHDGSKYTTTNL